jgi:hypothetical protein
MKVTKILTGLVCILSSVPAGGQAIRGMTNVPRIDSVELLKPSLLVRDKAVIWTDDFDGPVKPYTESSGKIDRREAFGLGGGSMLSYYEKGSRGVGNRKVFFGDSPTGKVVNKGQQYSDMYWRVYVKHQAGWKGGGPAKLSRATSIVSGNWAQAMIGHVWSSGEALTLDPASGVRGGQVVTRKYNDFEKLRWLGNKPTSRFKLHSTEESGWWVCVEARVKLNTPGKKDGLNQLWIDGRLEAERKNLDWRGSYTRHGINAVFLETYWNQGSPVTQSRWIDNFVISTQPIGPVVCPRNPILIKTPFRGRGEQQGWEVEVAADGEGKKVVWKSDRITSSQRIKVDTQAGRFLGALAGQQQLGAHVMYFVRVREQGSVSGWSEWSGWHQPFRTGK